MTLKAGRIQGDMNLTKFKHRMKRVASNLGGGYHGVRVVAGVDNDKVYPDGTSVLAIAIMNEFGIGIPERSFLRSTIAKKRREWTKLGLELVKQSYLDDQPIEIALEQLGAVMVEDIQTAIKAGIQPANAESTIISKGSSTPLIDTGLLLDSIISDVRIG